MKHLFDTIPRYHCTERCQAPNEFYSGSPFLTIPKNGILELKELATQSVEWQIWTSVNNAGDLKVFINGKQIQNPIDHNVDGLIFTMRKEEVEFLGKFLKVRASVKINSEPTASKWTISVRNDKNGKKIR